MCLCRSDEHKFIYVLTIQMNFLLINLFMRNKNILVANHHLDRPGGSETYTYAIIEQLVKQGYNVEYFTFRRGEIANRIEDNLSVFYKTRTKYDLILANHNTCVDYLYNNGFIIQTCHGVYPELEQPSPNANVYVAISEEVKQHLKRLGYNSKIILNGINLSRFTSINPISKKLKCVLSLCHSEAANILLREACNKIGATLLIQDKYIDPVWEVEQCINKADLVVGVGRSAYEAMACGRPVVIFDNREYYPSCGDGYVKDILDKSILNNCSGRYSNATYSVEELEIELRKYKASDGDFFRKFAEEKLNIHLAVEEYLSYYSQKKNNFGKLDIFRIKRHWRHRQLKENLKKHFSN